MLTKSMSSWSAWDFYKHMNYSRELASSTTQTSWHRISEKEKKKKKYYRKSTPDKDFESLNSEMCEVIPPASILRDYGFFLC